MEYSHENEHQKDFWKATSKDNPFSVFKKKTLFHHLVSVLNISSLRSRYFNTAKIYFNTCSTSSKWLTGDTLHKGQILRYMYALSLKF